MKEGTLENLSQKLFTLILLLLGILSDETRIEAANCSACLALRR